MAMTPEGALKSKIKKYLARLDHCWNVSPIGGAYSMGGVPDILVCWRGKFVGIEVKAPGKIKTLTALQRLQIEKINEANGIAFATDSLEDCIVRLEAIWPDYTIL